MVWQNIGETPTFNPLTRTCHYSGIMRIIAL